VKKVTLFWSTLTRSDPYVTFHSREAASNQPQLVFNT
jgi:hypothetical protein